MSLHKSSIKGEQGLSWHKGCHALSIMMKGFVDIQGGAKPRKETFARHLKEKALPRDFSRPGSGVNPIQMEENPPKIRSQVWALVPSSRTIGAEMDSTGKCTGVRIINV